jgi:hypothetical protein
MSNLDKAMKPIPTAPILGRNAVFDAKQQLWFGQAYSNAIVFIRRVYKLTVATPGRASSGDLSICMTCTSPERHYGATPAGPQPYAIPPPPAREGPSEASVGDRGRGRGRRRVRVVRHRPGVPPGGSGWRALWVRPRCRPATGSTTGSSR